MIVLLSMGSGVDTMHLLEQRGLTEATENSTENGINYRIMVQSFSSNGTALNQTEIGEDDNDMFPPEIVSFEDGAYGIMWTISSLSSSNTGYLQQSQEGDQLIIDIVPAPPVSCPASISFGPSAQLSPNGVVVRKSDVSYFNGNGYVAIWNTVDTTDPKAVTTTITAQLFDDNNGQVPGQTYSVTTTNQRIGKTIVSVFEDRSFVIAYSTQARTGANWQINVLYYQYQEATSTSVQTYTTTSTSQVTIQSSKHNNGRFSLTTLVLDNAFVIATMKDKYNIKIARYDFNVDPDTNEITSSQPYSDTIQPVKSSATMEIIVKAVPTQDFFTVIWSRLSKESDGKGIFLQNYKTPTPITPAPTPVPTDTPTSAPTEAPILPPNPVFSSPLSIQSNPRSIQADLSYGGTITVVWHEASTDCDNQQVLSYQAQMFNVTGSISQIIQVANGQNVPNSTPTPAPTSTSAPDTQDLSLGPWSWLHQVISYEDSFVVTFIDKPTQQQQQQLMTGRIFNKDGTLATSANQQLGQATQAPTAPPPTMVPTPPPTPAPTPTNTPTPQSQLREFYELSNSGEGSGSGTAAAACNDDYSDAEGEPVATDGVIAAPSAKIRVPEKGCKIFHELRNVCGANNDAQANRALDFYKEYEKLYNSLVSNNAEANDQNFKITCNYREIIYRFLVKVKVKDVNTDALPVFTKGEQESILPLIFLIDDVKYKFDCSWFGSSYAYAGQKSLYLCKKFFKDPWLPTPTTGVFYSAFGKAVRGLYNIKNKEDNNKPYDRCVLDAKDSYNGIRYVTEGVQEGLVGLPVAGCIQYFMEAAYTVTDCKESVCNITDFQKKEYITDIIEPLYSTLSNMIDVGFNALPQSVREIYNKVVGVEEKAPWNTLELILQSMRDKIDDPEIRYVYGPSTEACSTPSTQAFVTAALVSSTVFLCNPFIEDHTPFPQNNDEVQGYTRFRTIAHELSHMFGTVDRLLNGSSVYGYKQCKAWALEHSPIIEPKDIIADCLSFVVAQMYVCDQYHC